MKNKDLPFSIGEHYENWEHNLEILDVEEVIRGYDSYVYLGEIKFLGIVPQQTELVFLWDYLQAVIFTFKFEPLEQVNQFRSNLIQSFGVSKFKENFEVHSISDEVELWTNYYLLSSSATVLYERNGVLRNLIASRFNDF